MNIYSAALFSNGYLSAKMQERMNEVEIDIVDNMPHLLESYHYIKSQRYVDMIRERSATVFLDSGAFSAFTLGVTLSVKEYCDYILRNIDIIRKEDGVLIASVLDGIGDPLQTWRNQMEMEERGVKPLPCFHAGEDEKYLEWYISKYEYITLGGMVGTSQKQLRIWLDRIWERYLTDGSGRPRLKVHGFGITSPDIMSRYPWWSCDSSTWIQTARTGSIISPYIDEQGRVKWMVISLSDKSSDRFVLGAHAFTISDIEKGVLKELVESEGFSIERMSWEFRSRAAFNLKSYVKMNDIINSMSEDKTFACPIQELF